jgi:protein-S-isoprenylcysteine O-methyltransferase Ste14
MAEPYRGGVEVVECRHGVRPGFTPPARVNRVTTSPDTLPSLDIAVRVERSSRGRARALTWRRLVAFGFAGATLALARPAASPLQPWGIHAGAATAVLGEALRIWGCGHLRKNQDVISSGPYAHVRNPLYLGTLLILVGFCLAAGDAVVLFGLLPAGLLVFAGYYTPKKERVESDRLRRRFGRRFDAYRAAVPGYVPRITRWSGASRARWSAALVVENTELPTAVFVGVGLAAVFVRAFAG